MTRHEFATCRHCGQDIRRLLPISAVATWVHETEDRYPVMHCASVMRSSAFGYDVVAEPIVIGGSPSNDGPHRETYVIRRAS